MEEKDLRELLAAHGQEQVLRFWGELNEEERAELAREIAAVDWTELAQFGAPEDLSGKGRIKPIEGLRLEEIARRREEFLRAGRAAVAGGKVAAVLLAGGQGTRLGSDGPKGAYDIGLTRPVYIFGRLIANLLEVCEDVGAYVPLYIMTSEKNDGETRAFLKAHGYFGYPESEIGFFVQEMAPAVGLDGKLLLEEKGRLALSPNGNGGWYSSMKKAGLVERAEARGVEWYNVFAVDNVLQRIADPVFVGATLLSGKKCGAKVVTKNAPEERVGVLCLEDGRPSVIEYYEMSPENQSARDERGELKYLYGVILNYLFEAEMLHRIEQARIPVHLVKKKVPCLGEGGERILPQSENGWKFETLILDMVRLAGSCLPFEVERDREFAPIKNKTGVDSVQSARGLLTINGVIL